MAVVTHVYQDLATATDPPSGWISNGWGPRAGVQFPNKLYYFQDLALSDVTNFLFEVVFATADATNHTAARLWARFRRSGGGVTDAYAVEVRFKDVAGVKSLELWDTFVPPVVVGEPPGAQVGASLVLPAGADWSNMTRGLRVRLRLVAGILYLETEPAYDTTGSDRQWEGAGETLSTAVTVAGGLTVGVGSVWDIGFGNLPSETFLTQNEWRDVHVMTLDDQGMSLPHPPPLVYDDALGVSGTFKVSHTKDPDPTVHDSDTVTVDVKCANGSPAYLADDKVVVDLTCPANPDPTAHDFGNAPAVGTHAFVAIHDHQIVTAVVRAIDKISGREVVSTADHRIDRHIGVQSVPGGSQTLPTGRERLRYQSLIEALAVDLQPGDEFVWGFDAASSNTELAVYSQIYANPEDTQNTVRTPIAPVDYLPADPTPGGGTYPISVTITRNRGGVYFDGGNTVLLDLPVTDTLEDLDVAVLVDRSGSMAGDRWEAACNGAQMFATLARQANAEGGDHRVGVYWFWGDSNAGPPNYPNNPGYHANQGYHGTFPPESGTLPGDQLTLDSNLAVAPATDVYAACQPKSPDHYTGLGAGLLHCRDELIAAGPTPDRLRDRMIVLLSDGMENRFPKLQEVFYDGAGADPVHGWNHYTEPGDAGPAVHDPLIRIFSAAVHTSASWTNKLRILADHLGGDGALDVKPIANGETDGIAIQNWYNEVFTGLFHFTPIFAPADPICLPGQTVIEPVPVVLGQDVLVLYLLQERADPQEWDLSVKLPGTGATFVFDRHNAADFACVEYIECTMHKMFIVRPALDIPGHEHRWAGTWELRLTRTAKSQGTYALGAMAHQDFGAHVDVIAPPRPRPGDLARLRVELKDRRGNRLPDAKVTTRVGQPGPWAGDLLARQMSKNLKLVKQLFDSKDKGDKDMADVADRFLRRMIAKGQLPSGKSYNRAVPQIAPGVYELEIPLKDPGTYNFDTSIDGVRRFARPVIEKHLGPLRRGLRRNVHDPQDLAQELRYLERHASTRQGFHLETRNVVGVQLRTNLRRTPTEGYFNDKRFIRLELTPTDGKGRLLGPGWAGDVCFEGPSGIPGRWPSTDGGNGAYWVDIPVKGPKLRFDVARRALVADSLELRHPTLGLLRAPGNELPLVGFAAVVQGLRVPIRVQALVGNKSTHEVHLATCKHVQKVVLKHRVPFHDLEAAHDAGYDSCEVCLPLICNLSPRHMEAHKPFCGFVPLIKPRNRLEVTSWKAAQKLNFDGCEHCLPQYHTRRTKARRTPR